MLEGAIRFEPTLTVDTGFLASVEKKLKPPTIPTQVSGLAIICTNTINKSENRFLPNRQSVSAKFLEI